MLPVMWVVRVLPPEVFDATAFCRPMMNDSSSTVSGTANGVAQVSVMAPASPNGNISAASSSSGSAYTPCNRCCRAQFTSTAQTAAPLTNARIAPSAFSSSVRLPSTMPSASCEAKPVMCEVYMCSTRKPPALMAPALKASSSPSAVFVDGARWRLVRKRSLRTGLSRVSCLPAATLAPSTATT
ncbi:hypothetical protein FQZ97_907230 [compost metagenome]